LQLPIPELLMKPKQVIIPSITVILPSILERFFLDFSFPLHAFTQKIFLTIRYPAEKKLSGLLTCLFWGKFFTGRVEIRFKSQKGIIRSLPKPFDWSEPIYILRIWVKVIR